MEERRGRRQGMEMKEIEKMVEFEELIEMQCLFSIHKTLLKSSPYIDAKSLIYDKHHNLLVHGYIVKSFLQTIHLQENIKTDEIDTLLFETVQWVRKIEANMNMDEDPADMELLNEIKNTPYAGYISPRAYPYIISNQDIPYVPSWYALQWGKRAIEVLKDQYKEIQGVTNV